MNILGKTISYLYVPETFVLIVGLIALGFFSFFLVNIGIYYSFDSTAYAQAASWLSHNGHLKLSPHWPPGYPILLSVFYPTLSMNKAVAMVNNLSFYAVCTFSGLTTCLLLELAGISKSLRSAYASLVILLIITCLPLMSLMGKAWSEVPFAALVMAYIYFASLSLRSRNNKISNIIYISLLLSSIPLVRYHGLYMFIPHIYWSYLTIFKNKNSSKKSKTISCIAAISTSILPITFLLSANSISYGTAMGDRYWYPLLSYGHKFLYNLSESISIITSDIGTVFISLSAFSLTMLITFSIVRNSRYKHISDASKLVFPYVLLSALTILAHLLLAIHSESRVKIDPLSTRFFASLYPLIFTFGMIAIAIVLEQFSWGHKQLIVVSLLSLGLFIFWLQIPILSTQKNCSKVGCRGFYTSTVYFAFANELDNVFDRAVNTKQRFHLVLDHLVDRSDQAIHNRLATFLGVIDDRFWKKIDVDCKVEKIALPTSLIHCVDKKNRSANVLVHTSFDFPLNEWNYGEELLYLRHISAPKLPEWLSCQIGVRYNSARRTGGFTFLSLNRLSGCEEQLGALDI